MASLNQYRKGINLLDTSVFSFQKYLQPGETVVVVEDELQLLRETMEAESKEAKGKNKKKVKKVVKTAVADPMCDDITTGVITDFLKERLKISLPPESVILGEPITEFGEFNIPLKINHLLVSSIEERYLDPDILHRTDYEHKVVFSKGTKARPTKEAATKVKEEDDQGEATEAAGKEPTTPANEGATKKEKGKDAPKQAKKAAKQQQ